MYVSFFFINISMTHTSSLSPSPSITLTIYLAKHLNVPLIVYLTRPFLVTLVQSIQSPHPPFIDLLRKVASDLTSIRNEE